MKTKTIQIPPPLNKNLPAKTHCIGASAEGICAERSACVLHQAQLKAPAERPMLLPRVGTNQCHYRKEK